MVEAASVNPLGLFGQDCKPIPVWGVGSVGQPATTAAAITPAAITFQLGTHGTAKQPFIHSQCYQECYHQFNLVGNIIIER